MSLRDKMTKCLPSTIHTEPDGTPYVRVEATGVRFYKSAARLIDDPIGLFELDGSWYCGTDNKGWQTKVRPSGALEIVSRKLARKILERLGNVPSKLFELKPTEEKGLYLLEPINE
jgi:hypothetical protein